jgi:hypothetical protein
MDRTMVIVAVAMTLAAAGSIGLLWLMVWGLRRVLG